MKVKVRVKARVRESEEASSRCGDVHFWMASKFDRTQVALQFPTINDNCPNFHAD